MKSWIWICLTALAVGCTAGREPAGPGVRTTSMSVTIDFQTGFTGNWIELKLGEELIFSGPLTTDNRIGLAAKLRHAAPGGLKLAMTVIVDHSKTYPFQVDLDQGRYLGLKKDLQDGSIRLRQSRE